MNLNLSKILGEFTEHEADITGPSAGFDFLRSACGARRDASKGRNFHRNPLGWRK